jgi:3-methyladenine DNA glycosylase AlkD
MKATKPPAAPMDQQVQSVLAWLKRSGSKRVRDGMARYAIPSDKAFGVPVGTMRKQAKKLGANHDLALALWETGWYEARMMAAFLGEPERVTPAMMDKWRRDFDSWAICDTVCFSLFDRSEHAWKKVAAWSRLSDEFGKRAAFALLACLSAHDKKSGDEPFAKGLELIERAAADERNFVKKAVNWALRSIGKRSAALHAAAVSLAQRLADSSEPAARWIGKDALRDLSSPATKRRLAKPATRKRVGRNV